MKQRKQVTLRRGPTQEEIAAELISLLETISADGVIANEEVTNLRTWLADNADADLPAIDFLRRIVTSILADGVVTPQERKTLHLAVERVLPVELREKARGARQAHELIEKTRIREQKDAATQARKKNRPIASFNFMVAGVLYEGRAAVVEQFLEPEKTVFLIREPSNVHDANAISVQIDSSRSIGYVPREDAAFLAPLLDAGLKQQAYCTKVLEGRIGPIPVVQVSVYDPESTIPAIAPDQIEAAMVSRSEEHDRQLRASHEATGRGCVTTCAVIAALFGFVVVVLFLLLSR